MDLSHDQEIALKKLLTWFLDPAKPPFITLGGYAGTGKTTLISILRNELNEKKKDLKVAFVSYTGKATRVLKNKIHESKALFSQDSISTIHSLMYSPIVNNDEQIIGWEQKDEVPYDLLIVDEASMVDSALWRDLLTYQIPIIAVGDHGQLPPIKGNFNLMENPVIKLEEIHRQAKDNPIINLSIVAREKGEIPNEYFTWPVKKMERNDPDLGDMLRNFKDDTLVLCGYNTTRVKLNKYIRQALEFETPEPQARDRVICLRNNHEKQIFNGMLGRIKVIVKSEPEWFYAEIDMDGEESVYKGLIAANQFNNSESQNFTQERAKYSKGDLFDFGYAMTVHKAQGSQARRVILFQERFAKMDDEMWRRWLYTAVTRAEEELIII